MQSLEGVEVQYDDDIRDGQNEVVRSSIGASPTLEIWAGNLPKSCASPDAGRLLAVGTLPAEFLVASAGGLMGKSGNWRLIGQIGAGAGSPGDYFRIRSNGACKVQGTFGAGAEMAPEVNLIANGQEVVINSFDIRRGNA